MDPTNWTQTNQNNCYVNTLSNVLYSLSKQIKINILFRIGKKHYKSEIKKCQLKQSEISELNS